MASTLQPVINLQLNIYRGLYRLALLLAYPALALRLRWRARREPEYGERIDERYGRIPSSIPEHVIWFHAVSAGEVIACVPLLKALVQTFPQHSFLVTTTTPTGAGQLRRLMGEGFGNVYHTYAPYDFRRVQRRFFTRVKPALLVLVETELWPHQISEAHQRGVAVCLVNGRLSERSAARYRLIRVLAADMLSKLRLLACQSDAHARRFVQLGAPVEATQACGNLKFDVVLPEDHRQRVETLKGAWQLDDRFVWCAGSTHRDEEEQVLAAHRRLLAAEPQALLILAPRHPLRCAEVAKLLRRQQLSFVRFSEAERVLSDVQILLVDTLGQLQTLYGVADIAYLGGSLVPVGGHNPIEAAVCSVPMLIGPEHFNFADVVATFTDADAIELVDDDEQLANRLLAAFKDPDLRRRRGATARRVVAENRGALAFLVKQLSAEIRLLSSANDP